MVFSPEGIRKASAWELAPFAFLFKPKSEVVPSFGSFQSRISPTTDLSKMLWAQNFGEIVLKFGGIIDAGDVRCVYEWIDEIVVSWVLAMAEVPACEVAGLPK